MISNIRLFLGLLALAMMLSLACTLEVESPTSTAPASPISDASTVALPTATPRPPVVLQCPSNQRVELSVLVEPLDTGNVEIAGSPIITSGGATPVCKDDQINIASVTWVNRYPGPGLHLHRLVWSLLWNRYLPGDHRRQ